VNFAQRTLRFLENPIRTAIAAVVSLVAARLCRLPEAYWAPITTLIIMQSTLGSALTVSFQRLTGTALGAVAGALVATYLGVSLLAFGAGIFAIGLICALLRMDKAANRFAGIALAIVMLIAHHAGYWTVAFHRFFEVSLGLLVGLVITAVWPARTESPAAPSTEQSPAHQSPAGDNPH
jgi:uncharacterized membrane protein YgaE (UPF0421/DUF939 family)